MGLLDEFDRAQSGLKGPGVRDWYDRHVPDLTDEQKQALDEALRTPRFTSAAIALVLKGWGVEVRPEMVARKRRKLTDG